MIESPFPGERPDSVLDARRIVARPSANGKRADCCAASDAPLDRGQPRRRHSPPMPRLTLAVLIGLLVALAGVVVPPVLEDHLEPGFCSADCPVQHTGHGAAAAPPARPSAARRPAPIAPALTVADGIALEPLANPDAPRAPPAA